MGPQGANDAGHAHPLCPGCGARIGVYEPIWLVRPDLRAELTSFLRLLPGQIGDATISLWHEQCGRSEGLT